MDWILRSRWGSNLLLIAASAIVPAASVHFLMHEGRAPISGAGHLLIMGVGASVAAVASIALMARGLRSRDGRADTLFDARCVAELELLTAGTTRDVGARPPEQRAA